MKILLMRHCFASTVEQSGVKYDAERPLTEEGKKHADLVADFVINNKIQPTRILYTPFLRSKNTAELIKKRIGDIPEQASTALLPGAGVDDLLGAVSNNCMTGKNWTLVIMHEPDISYILARMILSQDEFPLKVYPGDLFAINVDIKDQEAQAERVTSFSPFHYQNIQ